MTDINDVVLVYYEDKPLTFARVEDVSPDLKRDWFHLKLLLLQLPLQTVTWILRGSYIEGEEFTMSGKRMRIEKVKAPDEPELADGRSDTASEAPKTLKKTGTTNASGKIVSLFDYKKK